MERFLKEYKATLNEAMSNPDILAPRAEVNVAVVQAPTVCCEVAEFVRDQVRKVEGSFMPSSKAAEYLLDKHPVLKSGFPNDTARAMTSVTIKLGKRMRDVHQVGPTQRNKKIRGYEGFTFDA